MAEPSGDMRPQQYKSKHPPEHYRKFHEWAREHDPDDRWPVYKVIKFILHLVFKLFRLEVRGLENLPESGMVLIVPNHFSFLDHFAVGMFVKRMVRFWAKSQLFDIPIARWIFMHGGVFPGSRGVGDELVFKTARIILGKLQAIVMYVQGGRSRSYEIDGEAKSGVGRIAHETGVPIVPTAIYGTQFLRHWKKPWKRRRGMPRLFPKIIVQFGEVIPGKKIPDATEEQNQALSDEVFWRVKEQYAQITQTVRH